MTSQFGAIMTSMTRRLVLGFGGAFIALTLVSGLFLFFVLDTQLKNQRRGVLDDRMAAINSLLKSPVHGLEALRERVVHEWPLRGGEKVYIDIRDADLLTVVATPFLPTEVEALFQEKLKARATNSLWEINAGDVGRGLLLRRMELESSSSGIKNPVTVLVAIDAEQGLDFLSHVREVLSGIFLFNLSVSLLVGWQIVRQEMRPLGKMAAQVATVDSQNLHERLPLETLPEELKGLAQSFNHSLDRIEDAFQRLSRFSSDLAHELKTPIANMMGTIEVTLARPRMVEQYRETLESSLEESQRISRIIDSLLFLARAENSERTLARVPLRLTSEIAAVLEFFEPMASEKSIALTLSANADPDAELLADPTLFQQALGNLVANAITYTPKHGQIEVDCQVVGAKVEVRVTDNGRGVSSEHLPFLFDRFYRVDPSRTLDSGGTGLGLAIVKSVVELHGGRVSVESALGRGSRFQMSFPLVAR